MRAHLLFFFFFFFNDTATTEIYTLSLHDALPILLQALPWGASEPAGREEPAKLLLYVISDLRECLQCSGQFLLQCRALDRKSTRLNSSHGYISYAVFCLKKKKNKTLQPTT